MDEKVFLAEDFGYDFLEIAIRKGVAWLVTTNMDSDTSEIELTPAQVEKLINALTELQAAMKEQAP